MFIEQYIIRGILTLPSLILFLVYLPIKNGGYQYLGITDQGFLFSGALDFLRLIVEIGAVLVMTAVLEALTVPKSTNV